jgi:hypothetical protein
MSNEIVVKQLPSDNWKKLKDIFNNEFDSDLPDPKTAEIVVAYENGVMVGFVLLEKVLIVGQIYVIPSQRLKNNSGIVRNLIRYVRDKVPQGLSVAAVASDIRFEALFKSLGMQKIVGTFFRRN